MITENIHTKTFKSDGAHVTIIRDEIEGKIKVKFGMPNEITSVTHLNNMILLLQEAKKEITVELKTENSTPERVSEDDSDAQS